MVGALARHLFGLWFLRSTGPGFPWRLLAINGSGCFLFGLVWALGEEWGWFDPDARVAVLAGFFGAFTTYSTFAVDTLQLFRTGGHWAANVLLTNVVTVSLVLAGMGIGWTL